MNPLLYLTPPQVIKLGAATADIGGWACRAAVGAGAMEWEVARAGVEAMYRHIRCSVGGGTPSHTELSQLTAARRRVTGRSCRTPGSGSSLGSTRTGHTTP